MEEIKCQQSLTQPKELLIKHDVASHTRESGPVFELTDLQHALAVLAVQDVGCCDVIQGVVLQRWRGRVKLGVEGERVGRAVSGSGADGANSFRCRLEGHWWAFVETILFTSGKRKSSEWLKGAQGWGPRL